jgi:uncharacterized protein (UPF0332 family)
VLKTLHSLLNALKNIRTTIATLCIYHIFFATIIDMIIASGIVEGRHDCIKDVLKNVYILLDALKKHSNNIRNCLYLSHLFRHYYRYDYRMEYRRIVERRHDSIKYVLKNVYILLDALKNT